MKRIEQKNGTRHYLIHDRAYPSVTSILQVLNKPALLHWAVGQERKLAAKAAWELHSAVPPGSFSSESVYSKALLGVMGTEKEHEKKTAEACNVGTQAHAAVESDIRNMLGLPAEPIDVCYPASYCFERYQQFKEQHQFKPLYCEKTMWSETYSYAGTADWVAELDGLVTIGDNKTSKAIYPEMLLQLAAYANAGIEMGLFTAPVQGAILRLPKLEKDPEPELRIWSWAEMQDAFTVFLAIKKVWEWQNQGE